MAADSDCGSGEVCYSGY
ncbi:MAG: hypothetical protein ACN6QY_15795 [Pseudomonas sp.]